MITATSKRCDGAFIASVFALMANIVLTLSVADIAYADYAEDLRNTLVDPSDIREGPGFSYVIKPLSKIKLQSYYFSEYAGKTYCIENSEGRCLERQYALFTTFEGNARIDNTFFAYYKTELDQDGELRLKKAYGVLRIGRWSWEVGKDTIWIGPGYHGSFILSNNAEGFRLVRVRTEEPFRLPWLFSYLGEFKYDLFRGWSQNFGILGHRLSLRPVPLLEIGANQVTYILPGRHYEIYEYPRVLFSSSDHSGRTSLYDNDQKASIDISLDMPFLSRIPPLVNGKVYAEYGGNDSFTVWQNADEKSHMRDQWKHGYGKWLQPIPYDFQNIAWLTGIWLTTGSVDYRVEYAQNYASYPLFYDYYDSTYNRRQGPWYSDLNTRYGMITGHHAGNDADDLYGEITIRRNPLAVKLFYDKERRGLSSGTDSPPAYRYQYGFIPSYRFGTVTFLAGLTYNHYRNVNYSSDPLTLDIRPGTREDEYIGSLGVEYDF